MGAYCRFCGRRCFVLRILRDGRTMCLATCAAGMEHDREACGEDHTTAHNPAADSESEYREPVEDLYRESYARGGV